MKTPQMYAAGKQIALACFSMPLLAQMFYQAVSSAVLCQFWKPHVESVAGIAVIAGEVPLVSIFQKAQVVLYIVLLLCTACFV